MAFLDRIHRVRLTTPPTLEVTTSRGYAGETMARPVRWLGLGGRHECIRPAPIIHRAIILNRRWPPWEVIAHLGGGVTRTR